MVWTLGDTNATLRALTAVTTHWANHDGGGAASLDRAYPDRNLAMLLVAVGLAPLFSSPLAAACSKRLVETSLAMNVDRSGAMSV